MSFDRSVMQLRQSLNQCQSDAESALRSIQRTLRLSKKIEHVWQQGRRNPHTGVAHANHAVGVLFVNSQPDPAAFFCVFGSIGQQVHDDLFESCGICIQPDWNSRQRHSQLMTLLLEEWPYGLNGPLHDAADRHPFLPQLHSTGRDSRDLQKVIDEVL